MAGFDGLNVLVTGAATGLGAATAVGVARQGARRRDEKRERQSYSTLTLKVWGRCGPETQHGGSHIPVPRPPRYSTLTR